MERLDYVFWELIIMLKAGVIRIKQKYMSIYIYIYIYILYEYVVSFDLIDNLWLLLITFIYIV